MSTEEEEARMEEERRTRLSRSERLAREEAYRRKYGPKMMEKYRKGWMETYGVSPTLPPGAQAFRQREIEKAGEVSPTLPPGAQAFRQREIEKAGGVEAIRESKLKALKGRISTRPSITPEEEAASVIGEAYQKYRSRPCQNQNQIDEKHVQPHQLIKLRVGSYVYCYDVIELYNYLTHKYSKSSDWLDPNAGFHYTKDQIELIQKLYGQLNSCSNVYHKYKAEGSGDVKFLIPRELYAQIFTVENPPSYLIFRIFNLENGMYTYLTADGYHEGRNNVVFVPDEVLIGLGLGEGESVLVEDCFNLPKLSYLLLQPENESWYTLPIDIIDHVKTQLSQDLEQRYVVRTGETLDIFYGGKMYPLRVVDILSTNNRRITAGVTKFTEVKVEFLPPQE